MLIKEITLPWQSRPTTSTDMRPPRSVNLYPTLDTEPADLTWRKDPNNEQEREEIQRLIATIDPKKETAQTLVNKLTTWLDEHPMLDRITDFLPQSRLVKTLARTIDHIEQGRVKDALLSVSGLVGGRAGDLAQGFQVGQRLAQGDFSGAARAFGGAVGDLARGFDMGNKLGLAQDKVQQGDLEGAARTIHPDLDRQRLKKLAGIDAQEPAPISDLSR